MQPSTPAQAAPDPLIKQLQGQVKTEQEKVQVLSEKAHSTAEQLTKLADEVKKITTALTQPPTVEQKAPTQANAPSKPMKTPQGLNNAMFSLNIGAIVLGLKGFIDFSRPISIAYILFFILFRIKMYLDASYFLEDETPDNRPYKQLGYTLAIFSWIAYAYSGYQLYDNPDVGYKFFILALIPSTLWIALILIKNGIDWLHGIWLLANLVYGFGTYRLIGQSTEEVSGLTMVSLGLIFIMLVIDAAVCKPFKAFCWKESLNKPK